MSSKTKTAVSKTTKSESSTASATAPVKAAKTTAKKATTTQKKAAEPKVEAEVAAPAVDSSKDEVPEKKERKRRQVTKESVDTDFTNIIHTRIEAEIDRIRTTDGKGIKFLRSINKALKTLHSDTKRVLKLKKKTLRKKNVVNGFLKPIKISPELATFIGGDVSKDHSRVEITKFICGYIKEHELFNPADRRLIVCDDKLKKLLNYDPENPPIGDDGQPALLNYFRLQKYLKPHFIKIETEKTDKKKAPAAATKKAAAAPKKKADVVVEDEEDIEEEEVDEE